MWKIASFHKGKLVSLLQDFSESLMYDLCAKSPKESHGRPNSPLCLAVEILFSLSNYGTRLHEIHFRKWGSINSLLGGTEAVGTTLLTSLHQHTPNTD